jgi:hypothetical protein
VSAPKYPLEAARALRAEEEEEKKRALAAAVRAQDEAAAAVARADRALRDHRAETARVAAEELERDRQGRKIDETLQAQAYLRGRGAEEAGLKKALDAARAEEREAAAAVEAARAQLAEARAAREAIEKHR